MSKGNISEFVTGGGKGTITSVTIDTLDSLLPEEVDRDKWRKYDEEGKTPKYFTGTLSGLLACPGCVDTYNGYVDNIVLADVNVRFLLTQTGACEWETIQGTISYIRHTQGSCSDAGTPVGPVDITYRQESR